MAEKLQRNKNQGEDKPRAWKGCVCLTRQLHTNAAHVPVIDGFSSLEVKKAKNPLYFWSPNKMSWKCLKSEMFAGFPLHTGSSALWFMEDDRQQPSSLPATRCCSALGQRQLSPHRSTANIDGAPRRAKIPSHLLYFALNTLISIPASSSFQRRPTRHAALLRGEKKILQIVYDV